MAKRKTFHISDALTEGLEETISAAHTYSGDLRVEVIPLKNIEVDPDNPREFLLTLDDLYRGISKNDLYYEQKSAEKISLQSISTSIKEQGIINPIIVYKFADKYRLVAGERRTLASVLAGQTDIQAKILENKPNDLKISLLQWIENVERKDLSLWERLRNLEKIVAAYTADQKISSKEISPTQISQLLNCTLTHAMNYFALLQADDEIRSLVKENQIKNLEKVAVIITIQSIELRKQLIQACIKGTTLKKLKNMARQEKIIEKLVKTKNNISVSKGRRAHLVNFGTTPNKIVAKVIVDSILANPTYSFLSKYFVNINWDDFKSVSNAFRVIIKQLEMMDVG